MFHKRNLVFIGLLLLLIFAVAVWLIGIGIDKAANRMHDSMVEEVGKYRADLIALDFQKTVEMVNSIQEYLEQNPDNEKGLQNLLRGLVRLDPKVTRIWYRNKEQKYVCIDSVGILQRDRVLEHTLENIIAKVNNPRNSSLYYGDGVLYWTLIRQFQGIVFGLDVSLPDLHAYFAGMSPNVRSYAYVLNRDGILIVHPDENRLGQKLIEPSGLKQFNEAVTRNQIVFSAGFSQYLLLPVKRVFYPVSVGYEKWIVVVNVPDLVTQEEMDSFHRYTLIIVILTVLLFSILLAWSQYRWRKEYDRRRQLEKETLQLNLQQLKNQINPHFLFNSLNSLNALIGNDPALAKEFVLNLSRIYRYVLEKRNDSLVAVREEVAFIRHYYFLQKIRFREQLELNIEEGLDKQERMIPLMSLQLLIENAIKHNEITRKNPLIIRIYLINDQLIIENSYHPRADSSNDSMGIGLDNIRQIYLYCSDKQFENKVEGDKFICILPLL